MPLALTSLACHLSYQSETKIRQHAVRIMRSASDLGDSTATFCIITNYLKQGTKSIDTPTFKAALERLGIMAKKDGNPEAMAILAKFLLSQKQTDEALKWFHKATDRPDEALNDFTLAGHALVEQARIHLSRKEMEKMKRLLQRATEVLEEPSAFFYLSAFHPEGSEKQKECLTMAATMGITEAAHNLGGIALAESKTSKDAAARICAVKRAQDWYEVAAAGGFGYGIMNLALLNKSLGKMDAALDWLAKAEELPDMKEEARKLRMDWSSLSKAHREK